MASTIDGAPAVNNQQLVAELLRCTTFEELRRSAVYAAREAELRLLIDHPRVHLRPGARPRLSSFLRVVEWNIERGARLEGVIETLNSHEVLHYADLLLLNELDDGMNRSGNVNVPLELSRALDAHAVFGVEYLELTKGAGRELHLPGENTAALHGNAILTRHTFSDPEIVKLPRCENNFESAERRIGGRIGILLDLQLAEGSLTAATTHLDVVNSPRCRAGQMRAMLQAVDARVRARASLTDRAALVGGDLNTHTFSRGGRLRAMMNTALILGSRSENLANRLRNPESREPAIPEFARYGYETRSLNDSLPTARSLVSSLDDSTRLPGLMKWWVKKRIPREGLMLEFRLDWLAARGLKPLAGGEIVDKHTGVKSVAAHTVVGLNYDGEPISDHDPIVIDISLPQR